MRCARVERFLGGYVCSALPPPVTELVSQHLKQCETCHRAIEAIRFSQFELAELGPPAPEWALDVARRVVGELHKAEQVSFPETHPPVPSAPPRSSRRHDLLTGRAQ